MGIDRKRMFKFPWSRSDNPGGWVEVTDECDLSCPGCYRHNLSGHVPLEEVKADILRLKKLVNCDGIAIAGGEPLLYPPLLEVVEFITRNGLKSMLLTNAEKLTWEFAMDLRRAGLTKILIHVDSQQKRPGWEGKTENEMNQLRQRYADLIWEIGRVHCGFHLTIYRSTLPEIPGVVEWFRKNIHKVQHLSLIAFRGLPLAEDIEYVADGQKVDLSHLRTSFTNLEEISISADEIFETLEKQFPDAHPSAYLNGTTAPETYKYLIITNLGSKEKIYGTIGHRTIELTQMFHHLIKGKYSVSTKNMKVGKKVFLLSPLDPEIRKAFLRFIGASVKNPARILDRIRIQTLNIQQPREVINGENNLCDGCLNQMLYKGKLINSCTLDEFRLFGALLTPIRHAHAP
jgi:hypothetical protein